MTLIIKPEAHFEQCIPEIKNAFIEMSKKYDVIIADGWRSKEENDAVKGSANSLHLCGKAIDFRINNVDISKWGWIVFQYLPQVKGIGFNTYFNAMHVDLRDSKEVVHFNYDRRGHAI